MFTLLTTAARLLLFEQVLRKKMNSLHLAITSQTPVGDDATMVFVSFNHKENIAAAHAPRSWVDSDGAFLTCSTRSTNSGSSSGEKETSIAAAERLHSTYLFHNRSKLEWLDAEYLPSHNCYLYDYRNNNVWVMADYVGSHPLWYGLTGDDFIISDDWLLVQAIGGGGQTTPASAGTLHSIDIESRGDVLIAHFQTKYMSRRENVSTTQLTAKYSYTLLACTMQALTAALPVLENRRVYIEADGASSMGRVVACALTNLGVPYYLIPTTAVEATEEPATNPLGGLQFSDIWGTVVEGGLFRSKDEAVDSRAQAEKTAIDRWNFCVYVYEHSAGGDITGYNATVIAATSGLSPPSDLAVYFQRYFCEYFNITVLHPLNNLDSQLSIWAADNVHAYIKEAFVLLSSQGVCSTAELPDPGVGKVALERAARPPSNVARLWESASAHASATRRLVLVLATRGYEQMLGNFLCSARALPGVARSNILVLTLSEEIAILAANAGVAYYMPELDDDDAYGPAKSASVAKFGTVLYQYLILQRTRVVHELLLLGFKPIIADIDTVWKKDPLSIVDNYLNSREFDLATCYDEKEICGCFLALNNNDDSILFWDEVHRRHKDIVASNIGTDPATSKLQNDFADSEQKVLTNLLLGGEYAKVGRRLRVVTLPRSLFPSGIQYFNFGNTSDVDVAVIHNNFAVGLDYKVHRFKRRRLWLFNASEPPPGASGFSSRCTYDVSDYFAFAFGSSLDFKASMPSLVLANPSHNRVYLSSEDASSLLIGSSEGIPEPDACLRLWIDVDPPSFFTTYGFSIQQYNLQISNVSKAFTLSLCDRPHIVVSSIAAFDTPVFSLDFAGDAETIRAANERVIAQWLGSSSRVDSLEATLSTDGESPLNPSPSSNPDLEGQRRYKRHEASYAIKVLAFKRPASLTRLLASLSNAHYPSTAEISLEIFIDGGRTQAEEFSVEETVSAAEAFNWTFGQKRVVRNAVNKGLVDQWLSAWAPDDDSHEVAFIFEDDVEVSPLYFQWASRAVETYYTEEARAAHRDLLLAVRSARGRGAEAMSAAMSAFAKSTAGIPLMYGVCLQRQHGHPFAYPAPFEVRNGNRPYLHSLVGSWGPLFFPSPWVAFVEWQRESTGSISSANDVRAALATRTIIDHYMSQNPRLWTPYMVKFSSIVGLKCLYSNLPEPLALAASHREGDGENYEVTEGADATLLRWDDVYACDASSRSSDNSSSSSRRRNTVSLSEYVNAQRCSTIHNSYYSMPSLQEGLGMWQLDLSMRRHGAVGHDKTFSAGALQLQQASARDAHPSLINLSKLYAKIDASAEAFSAILKRVFKLDYARASGYTMQRGLVILLADIIIATAANRIVHIEPSALLTFLASLYPQISHQLLSAKEGTCDAVRGSVYRCFDGAAMTPTFEEQGDSRIGLLVINADLATLSSFRFEAFWNSACISELSCIFDKVLLLHTQVSSAPTSFRVGALEYTLDEEIGGSESSVDVCATLYALTAFVVDTESQEGVTDRSILLTRYVYDSVDSITFLSRRRQIV